jgi:hypothetical protein
LGVIIKNKKEMTNFKEIRFHQGDVQGKSIPKLPDNAVKVSNKPLAYGEVSGHVHVLTGDVDLFEIEGKTYAVIGHDGARMQHVMENILTPKCMMEVKELHIADHKSILFPPGIYEIGIQKQYNPYKKVFERVID